MNRSEFLEELAPVNYVSREEMMAFEKVLYADGVDPFVLMEKAGKKVAEYIRAHCDAEKQIAVLCSSGNNGGDALVAASFLKDWNVTVFKLTTSPMKTPEGRRAEKMVLGSGHELYVVIPPEIDATTQENQGAWQPLDVISFNEAIRKTDLIIDGIFGLNIRSEIRPPISSFLQTLAVLKPPCQQVEDKVLISIDLPSGLDANTGVWHGPEFQPDVILTMQVKKNGLRGLECEIEVLDIGIPVRYHPFDQLYHTLWCPRNPNSHKGDNGRVMIVGGSDEYPGAPVLSSMAAMRVGADTVRTAVPESVRDIVAGFSPNFLVIKARGEYHNPKNLKFLSDLAIRRHQSVVVGMGSANKSETYKFLREFILRTCNHVQLVIDADAIRAMRGMADKIRGSKVIITPHKAELRTFLQEEIPAKREELIEFVHQKAKDLGIIIVLKGREDIVSDGERLYLNVIGHPGMTVGGSGDVLAGVIGGTASFVPDPFFAAVLGTYIMGKAGKRASDEYDNALTATDIINEIGHVINDLEKSRM